MTSGVAGNGREGRWYVEVEEEIESEESTLIIQDPLTYEEIRFPRVKNIVEDIDNLIKALTQAKTDVK